MLRTDSARIRGLVRHPHPFANGDCVRQSAGDVYRFQSLIRDTCPHLPPLIYSWDFGDGTTSTDPNPDHVYSPTADTTYTVTCEVKDSGSYDQSATMQEKVRVAGIDLGDIVVSPQPGCVDQPMLFSESASTHCEAGP